MKSLVSVVITLYNYEKYIEDCIGSCLWQTYDNIEIWVIDDCSTDKSFQILDENYRQTTCLSVWRHRTNKGIAASKNTGIRASKGDYITFLDADDMLTPDSIEKRMKVIEKKHVDIVHGYAYKIGPDDIYDYCMNNRKKLILSGKPESVNAQTTLYKREVFEKYGLFYESRELHSKEDTEMMYRLGLHYNSPLPKLVKAHKINKPTALAFHRYHDKSAKNSRTEEQKEELKKAFDRRIYILKRDGITKSNTEFL